MFYSLSLYFPDHGLTIVPIPSNTHTAHMKVSTITGACREHIAQYTSTNEITRNPSTPQTLLEDTPESEVTTSLNHSLIFFITYLLLHYLFQREMKDPNQLSTTTAALVSVILSFLVLLFLFSRYIY